MNKPSSKKTWIWGVGIVLVAVIAYFYFSGGSAPSSQASLQVQAGSVTPGSQVLALLNQIQSLRIDRSLFSDPGYKSLQDYSVAIPPQGVGRADPFAPLPGDAVSAPASAATAPAH